MIIAIVIALLLMLCQVKNATLIDCQNDQKWKLMKTFSSRKSSNSLTSFGEYTKSTICENTQERERNPSNNEISLDKGKDYTYFIYNHIFTYCITSNKCHWEGEGYLQEDFLTSIKYGKEKKKSSNFIFFERLYHKFPYSHFLIVSI